MTESLAAAAVRVLTTSDPSTKATASRDTAIAWHNGLMKSIGTAVPPDRPARPQRPLLLSPTEMPKRRGGRTPAARVALLHALAHIELNAIDLAWDIVARFTDDDLPRAFYDDWVHVADDEAKHFLLLVDRLADFDTAYGDLPAHDGLWEAAQGTAGSLLARLAIVPMVLEARGLDVTPAMIDRMTAIGDEETAAILSVIYEDEIGHVAVGRRWFTVLCDLHGHEIVPTWQNLVRCHFRGTLKAPFNRDGRDKAGLDPALYEPLAIRESGP